VPTIHKILLALLLGAIAGAGQAQGTDEVPITRSGSSPRIYITLVPRAAEAGFAPDSWPHMAAERARLDLPIRTSRRNRLAFSLVHRDILSRGDVLQLRLASDAHVLAQLLSGGQFSDADDSWIAVLGLASRVRLSYTNGPWSLSLTTRRKIGDSNVRARLNYTVRF
jgi:hypothetical protein